MGILAGRARLVEPTGPQRFVFRDSPTGALMCRASGRLELQIGDTVHLRWSPGDVPLFDADGLRRIGP